MQPRPATRADVDRVVEILVGAFHTDPTWSWVFADPQARPEQLRRLWAAFVHGAMRYPNTLLNKGDTATAVWIPPGGTDLSEEQEADLEPLVEDLMGADAPRLLATFDAFEQAHPRDVPHFYLSLLGTAPEHRGQGYGLALLADSLRQIDDTGMPAYLEASNPVNVALYARYGFVVRAEFSPAPDGPVVTTMWRDGISL